MDPLIKKMLDRRREQGMTVQNDELEREQELYHTPVLSDIPPADYDEQGRIVTYDARTGERRYGGLTVEEGLAMEGGGLQIPFFDPLMMATGVGPGIFYHSLRMGTHSILNALTRSMVVTGTALVGEAAVQIPADRLEEAGHPLAALGLSVLGGIGSAVTLEAGLERLTLKGINKINPNFFKKTTQGITNSGSKHFSEEILEELERHAYKADVGDEVAADTWIERIHIAMGKEFEKNKIPHEQVVYADKIPESIKKLQKKLGDLAKKSIDKLSQDDYEDIQRLAQAETYKAAWEGFKEVRKASNIRLAKMEYESLPHTQMIEYLKNNYRMSLKIFDTYDIPKNLKDKILRSHPELFHPEGLTEASKMMRLFKYGAPLDFFQDLASAQTLKQVVNRIANRTSADWSEVFQEMWAQKILEKEKEYLEKVLGVSKRTKIPKKVPKEQVGEILDDVKALKNSISLIHRGVGRAFKKGNKIGAIRLRIREIETRMALQRTYRRAQDVRRWKMELKRLLKTKSLPTEYKIQLKALLKPFFQTSKYVPDAQVSIYKFLQTKVEDGILDAGIISDEFTKIMSHIIGREFKDLSYNHLERFREIIKSFHKLGLVEKNATHLLKGELIDDIIDTVHITATRTFGNSGTLYKGIVPSRTQLEALSEPAKSFLAENKEKIADLFGRYLAHTARMEKIVEALDGFKPLGRMWRTILKPFVDAENLENALSEKTINRLDKLFTKHGGKYGYWGETAELMGAPVKKEHAVMMKAYMGNPEQKKVLLHGLSEGKPRLNEKILDEFLDDFLNEKDLQLVEDLWQLMEDFYPLLNKIYKEVAGVDLVKVEGKYMPIMQDFEFKNLDRKLTDLFKNTNASQYWASVQKGFTIPRHGGTTALRLDFDVLARHLRETIHYSSHHKPLNEVQKIVRNANFRKVVESTLGKHIYKQFDPWLKNIARPDLEGPKWLRQLRGNVTVANLGMKLTTAFVQPLSVISSVPRNGLKNTIVAIAEFASNPAQVIKAVNDIDPQMRYRANHIDRDFQLAQRELLGLPKKGKAYKGIFINPRLRNFFFSTVRIMDQFGSYPAWLAGHKKGMQLFKGNVDSALEYASQAVRVTQPQSSAKDLPRIMRSNEFERAITMFYSYFSVLQNQIVESLMRYGAKDINFFRLSSDMLYYIMLPALAAHTIREGGVKKEDLLPVMLTHGAGGFPIFRDIASFMFMGYPYQLTPMEDVPKEIVKLGTGVLSKIDGDPETDKGVLFPLISTVGYATGLPTAQSITIMKGLMNQEENPDYTWWDIMVKRREMDDDY